MNTRIPALIILVILSISSNAQTIAFPGADGYGKYTTGGRGGKVIKVTNLNDDGEGSLRKAIRAKGPRIIIFNVAGTIHLKSPLEINEGNVTIAGQSAPGQGICVADYPTRVKASNVIIRYMKFRLGDAHKVEDDALSGRYADSVIIDHCSVSWSTDEAASFYRNKNFTMQWCLIAHSLNESAHSKGAHGYGGIWGGMKASFHHNLLANHNSRNPRFSGSETTQNSKDELVDFRNNVIFNWGMNSSYGGETGHYNVVNNYYKPGPATTKARKNRILNPSIPYGKFYVNGNVMEGSDAVTKDNWNGGVQCDDPLAAKSDTIFPYVMAVEHSASEAYDLVLQFAGAARFRDQYDQLILEEAAKGIATAGKQKNGIIDSPEDVGGFPVIQQFELPVDTDGDGIPDSWEKQYGLNPNDPTDATKFSLSDKYMNIELYLNELVTAFTPVK